MRQRAPDAFVLEESALRNGIGGVEVMAAQLGHLITVSAAVTGRGPSPAIDEGEAMQFELEPLYQVIRTKICDPWPNQVAEIATYHNERAAEAVADIWGRLPAVKAGRERVRIVRHLV